MRLFGGGKEPAAAKPAVEVQPAAAPPKRPSLFARLRRRLAFLIVLCGIVLWLLPIVIAKSGLVNDLLKRLTAGTPNQIEVGEVSLNWFSPIILRDVRISNGPEKAILTVAEIRTSRVLLQHAANYQNLGVIHVHKPNVTIELSEKSSNVEAFLAGLPKSDAPASEPAAVPELFGQVEVSEATLSVHDGVTDRQWSLAPVAISVRLAGRRAPATINIHAPQRIPIESRGLEAQIEATWPTEASYSGPAEATITTERFPLDVVETLVRRFDPQCRLAAELTGRCSAKLAGAPGSMECSLEVDQEFLGVSVSASAIGSDTVRLPRLAQKVQLSYSENGRLRIDDWRTECDALRAVLQGEIEYAPGALLAVTPRTLSGTLWADLKQVTEQFPATLRLRKDVSISSGEVLMTVTSSSDDNGTSLKTELRLAGLKGEHSGKPIEWKEPVEFLVQCRQDATSRVFVDDLRCQSGFLTLSAAGSTDQFTAQFAFDLDRLSEQTRQLIDLGTLQMSGRGNGRAALQSAANGYSGTIEAGLTRLKLAQGVRQLIDEDAVSLRANAAGRIENGAPRSIDQGWIELTAGADRVLARLETPIADLTQVANGSVRIEGQGDIDAILRRLRLVADVPVDLKASGNGEFATSVVLGGDEVNLPNLRLVIRNAKARHGSINVDEPMVDVQGSVTLSLRDQAVLVPSMQASSTTISARVSNLNASFGHSLVHSGQATYLADLRRLSALAMAPSAGDPVPAGMLSGTAVWEGNARQIAGQFAAEVKDFSYPLSGTKPLREPKIVLETTARYEPGADRVRIEQLRLLTQSVGCHATGSVEKLSSAMDVYLQGMLAYDLEQLSPLASDWMGIDIRAVSRDQRPFSIHGPLAAFLETGPQASIWRSLAAFRAEGAVAWKSVSAYGFQAGPAEAKAKLDNQLLAMHPLQCSVNNGRLSLQPSLTLVPTPVLEQPAARILDHVQVTPQMCAGALRYAAPVLAGALKVDGELSVELDKCRVPIEDWTRTDAAGKIVLHTVYVEASPLIQELSRLFQRSGSFHLAKESTVPFRVIEGRVYHANLRLQFPDMVVTTSGSVGLDGTLDLVAQMPIPPNWLPGSKIGQTLENKTVRLPIRGTLERPKLDDRGLRKASVDLIRDSAADTLKSEVGNQLQRLFGPKE